MLVIAQHGSFTMEGALEKVRVVRFTEMKLDKHGKPVMKEDRNGRLVSVEETSYMISSSLDLAIKTIWKVMHLRWDIEDACFHVLCEDFHLKYLYSHMAAEQILALTFLAFNIRNLYLFRFRERDYTSKECAVRHIMKRFEYDLYAHFVRELLRGH